MNHTDVARNDVLLASQCTRMRLAPAFTRTHWKALSTRVRYLRGKWVYIGREKIGGEITRWSCIFQGWENQSKGRLLQHKRLATHHSLIKVSRDWQHDHYHTSVTVRHTCAVPAERYSCSFSFLFSYRKSNSASRTTSVSNLFWRKILSFLTWGVTLSYNDRSGTIRPLSPPDPPMGSK